VCVCVCVCVSNYVCDLETSKIGRPRPEIGCCATETKMYFYLILYSNDGLGFVYKRTIK
jgi:hypothetical protein